MSYSTLKHELTSNAETKQNYHDALNAVHADKALLIILKSSIIDVILIPSYNIVYEYVDARQQYLNSLMPYTPDASNVSGNKLHIIKSPITHTYNTSLCHNAYFGKYGGYFGSLKNWQLEKWSLYRENTVGSTFFLVPCARYAGVEEAYDDIDQDKIDILADAPYSLDTTGRHSLQNIQSAVSSFDAGMNWIWATTDTTVNQGEDPATSSSNPWTGSYNSWGINYGLDNIEISIASLSATIVFKEQVRDLNSRF